MKTKNDFNPKRIAAGIKCLYVFIFLIGCLAMPNLVFATTFTSQASASWDAASTWSPNGIPTSNDDVIIANGYTVTMFTHGTPCRNLTINNGGTLTISGSNRLDIFGNYTNNGTFNANTGTVMFRATSAGKTISGTLTGSGKKFNNVDFNGSGGWTFSNDAEIGGDINLMTGNLIAPSGNLSVKGSWQFYTGFNFTHNNGTVIFTANSSGKSINGNMAGSNKFNNLTFNGAGGAWSFNANTEVNGNFTITNGSVNAPGGLSLSVKGNWNNSGTFSHNNGSVIFTATDAGHIISGSNTFFDLTFNGSGGAWIMLNNTVVNKNFAIVAGSLTAPSGLTVSSFSNSGTFTHNNGTVTLTGGLGNHLINGSTSTTFYNLVIDQVITLGIATSVANNFTINPSANFDVSTNNYALTIGGNWVNNYIFNYRSGTVTFNGSGPQTLSGSSVNTFYNLILNKSDGQTLSLSSGQNINVYGILNFTNGKASGGNINAFDNVIVGLLWDGGNTKLTFAGSLSSQTFNLSGAEGLFQGDIEINKSSNLTLASNLIMNTANQAIILSSGNLMLNSKTITLYNSSVPSGTVSGNGTFTITGPGTFNMYNFYQNVSGVFTLSGVINFHTYNYFKKETNVNASFYSGSAIVDIDGAFINTAGAFSASSGIMYVGGNWTRTGGSFTHNSGTVIFDGNNSTYTDANAIFYNITINKNVGHNITIAIGSSMYTNVLLTLNQGNIITTVWSQLELGCDVTIVMGNSPNTCSSASFVDGPLSRHLCSAGSLFYPIGRNGSYRPLTLTTVPVGSILITAEQIESSIPAWCLPADLCSVSKRRHFRITINVGTIHRDPITLSYCADDGVTNASDLRIAKQTGICWENMGGAGTANGSGTITSTVEFTTYGDFILASKECLNELPVKLMSFVSNLKAETIFLNWKTASEINNDRFEVERSLDGTHWTKIGVVKGNGNSNVILNYNFEDHNLPAIPKVIYYRLKQTDFNGEFEYSPMVVEAFPGLKGQSTSTVSGGSNNFSIYPNPANEWVTIENRSIKKSESHIEISDLTGKKWMNDRFTDQKTIELNSLAPGLYLLNIYNLNGEIVSREKIIVHR